MLAEHEGFDEVGHWKINEIKHFTFRQNPHAQVNKTVGIVVDCMAMVLEYGVGQ